MKPPDTTTERIVRRIDQALTRTFPSRSNVTSEPRILFSLIYRVYWKKIRSCAFLYYKNSAFISACSLLTTSVALLATHSSAERRGATNHSVNIKLRVCRYGSAWGRADALWCALATTRERRQQLLYGSHRASVTRPSFSTANLLEPLKAKEREGRRAGRARDTAERRATSASASSTAVVTGDVAV